MTLSYGRATLATLLLLQFHLCFAATTIYVNVNNPTPGAGTSWATAYTDFNAALAAAPYGANIWVAQGTYRPTTTTDRTIAFEPPKYVLIYGGFVGNETLLTQRNYKSNPTILSGDIGVAGDASDNSYNVVRFNAGSNGSSVFNGFTIRDGNANAGYPGSTTPSEYNQGGGVLLYANLVSTYSYAYANVENCTFLNNFAVYGGAYSSYSSGGNTVCYASAWTCVFDHNTAVMGGGAFATVSIGGQVVGTSLLSCVFTNNTSTSGAGSALASYVNGNMYAMGTTAYNCVFYNNPLPAITNVEQGGQISNIDFWYSIFWNATTVPANSFVNAGDIKYHSCDIDQAAVPTTNVNFDPLFVNAPGGDFHVSPCSPVIDYGGPMTYSAWNVDLDGNPRVQGLGVDLGAYETPKATALAAPTVSSSNPTYCQGVAVTSDLSGLVVAPVGTLIWYDATNALLPAAPTPSTSSAASTIYYVSQSSGTSCESSKTQITATVKAAPAMLADPSLSYCLNATPASLNLSITKANPSYTLKWYTDATGSTVLPATPVISTATAGDQYFYVTQKTTAGCESQILTIDVPVKETNAPATNDPLPSYCQGATANILDVTGTALLWYTAVSGGSGTVLTTIPTPSTSTTGTQNYYVSQTVAGCESPRTNIVVTVKSAPGAPAVTSPLKYCQQDIPGDLDNSVTKDIGASLTWYAAPTGGPALPSTPQPSTASGGTQTYYVSQTLGCEGPRSAIAVITTNRPGAPTTNNASLMYCQGVTAANLTATGNDLQWYDALTGGNLLPSAPQPSTATPGTQNYYVSQTVSGCESPRTDISITVETKLPVPDATGATYCMNDPAAALIASGKDLLWYTTASGGIGATNAPLPVTTASGNTTWYVTQSDNGSCESERKAVTVIVNALPKVSIDPLDRPYCPGSSVQLEASGATTYQWSPATNLSSSAVSNPQALFVQEVAYTVIGTDDNGCKAMAQVDLQVSDNCDAYSLPSAFTPNGDGHNDLFRVHIYNVPKSFNMQVFNRYGERVFSSTDINTGWDGTLNGSQAGTGAYVYMIMITTAEGKAISKKGTVMLIR
ncbi:MAG TPA: gliding motility-associated C-terminal domain-containing protein [Puia sp.]|nr:gliding motility-associated C-terminal domain-containing protein [Puia sp.]